MVDIHIYLCIYVYYKDTCICQLMLFYYYGGLHLDNSFSNLNFLLNFFFLNKNRHDNVLMYPQIAVWYIDRRFSGLVLWNTLIFRSIKQSKQVVHSAFPYFLRNIMYALIENWQDLYFVFWSRFRFGNILLMVLDSLTYNQDNFHSFQVRISTEMHEYWQQH